MNVPSFDRPARRRAALLAAVAASAVAGSFATASPAHAACYGSTPSSVAYADPFDGDSGLAPEITTVQAGVDAGCAYVVDPGIARPLIDGDAVFVYIDADGNPATGSPVMTGADVVMGTLGVTGPEGPPRKGVWTGAGFAFSDPAPAGAPIGNGGFSSTVDRLGIVPGATTHLVVGTSWTGIGTYFDFAPNPGLGTIALPVSFSTTPAPAPAPAAAPTAAPAPAPAPAVRTVDDGRADDGCRVPGTRGMAVGRARARLRGAGCPIALRTRRIYSSTVRRGRVVRTTVRAGAQTSRRVGLVVSRGRRRHRARAATLGALARLNRLVAAEQEQAAARP